MPSDISFYYYLVGGLLVLALIIIVVLEVFLNFNDVEGDNMNIIIKNWVYSRYFFITFFWGVITGHLFLGSSEPLVRNTIVSVSIVAALSILLLILGIKIKSKVISQTIQLTLLILGILLGHFFWSMNDLLTDF